MFVILGAIAEIVVAVGWGVWLGGGMPAIALSMTASYVVSIGGAIVWLRRRLHGLELRTILRGTLTGLVLGGLGAAAGAGVLWALESFAGPLVSYVDGVAVTAPIAKTLVYVVVAGLVSLAVTFVPAVALKVPEAGMIRSIVGRFTRR